MRSQLCRDLGQTEHPTKRAVRCKGHSWDNSDSSPVELGCRARWVTAGWRWAGQTSQVGGALVVSVRSSESGSHFKRTGLSTAKYKRLYYREMEVGAWRPVTWLSV